MQWQTYDISFEAPPFGSTGPEIENTRVKMICYSVTVRDLLNVPRSTSGAQCNNATGAYRYISLGP